MRLLTIRKEIVLKWISRKVALAIVAGIVIVIRPEIAQYAIWGYGIYVAGNVVSKFAKK